MVTGKKVLLSNAIRRFSICHYSFIVVMGARSSSGHASSQMRNVDINGGPFTCNIRLFEDELNVPGYTRTDS
jgi:hypothetical protein